MRKTVKILSLVTVALLISILIVSVALERFDEPLSTYLRCGALAGLLLVCINITVLAYIKARLNV